MNISTKIKRLQSVDLHQIVNDAAMKTEKQIITLNQDQMYKEGVLDVERPGKKEKYAASTIRQKKRKAKYKKTEFITLRWFGDFYDAMKIIFFKDRFVLTSDDLKWANWLEPQDRFSHALGLTDKSRSFLKTILKPEIINRLKRVI